MDPSETATLVLAQVPAPETVDPPPAMEERYEDLGLVALGGMGEIRRVRDRVLDREVVVKVLRTELSEHPELMRLFVQEARLTAGLQHPHVVPVHDLGHLPDGRLFFSMKEVHGHTLVTVLRELHGASRHGAWGRSAGGWTLRRVIDVFHQVVLTVAYAHARGVVHGDLKPENVMVGPYGEVQVMDWGLASIVDPNRPSAGIAGTPAYMSPEQADGAPRGVLTDVWALGATLYEILAGHPPYVSSDPQVVLRALRARERPAPFPRIEDGLAFAETRDQDRRVEPSSTPPVPRALEAIVRRAMAMDPEDRYRSARSLGDDLMAFVEGTRRLEDAVALVAEATSQLPEIARLRERAETLRRRAADRLAAIPRSAPEQRKRKAWALQDEAVALDREAELREIDLEGTLRGVLSLVPGLPAAHAALAEQLRERHAASERQGQVHATSRLEVQLRAHVLALPPDHPKRPELVQYLKGEGSLTLHTSVPADVIAHRHEVVDRRLVLVGAERLGRTPIEELRLPMGSYLLVLKAAGRLEVRYPVLIERNVSWSTSSPGRTRPEPVEIPARVPERARYVPAGWTVVGGGDQPMRRVWIDGFAIDRDPVTNRDYLEFVNDLAARGRGDEAERHVPRERTGTDEPRSVYVRGADGRYALGRDQDGDEWDLDWPVMLLDWNDAQAYAAWRAERDRLPWRLPSEWEREKASRGVDGRSFPWGEQEEDTWAATVGAAVDRPLLTPVDRYPIDVSPYDVRGCAGNVHDWCLESRTDPTPNEGERVTIPASIESAPYRALRGGGWHTVLRNGRCGLRHFTQEHSRMPYIGFRLVYPIGPR